MVNKGSYVKLTATLLKTGIVDLVPTQQKEINGLFGVPKEGDTQWLIPDARRPKLNFTLCQRVQNCPTRDIQNK